MINTKPIIIALPVFEKFNALKIGSELSFDRCSDVPKAWEPLMIQPKKKYSYSTFSIATNQLTCTEPVIHNAPCITLFS